MIEDDCFIGSDATLVAPVRIAALLHRRRLDHHKDTPAASLPRAGAQVSIASWKPPRERLDMCGIVGATRFATSFHSGRGLAPLEYRGYDSCACDAARRRYWAGADGIRVNDLAAK